MPWPFGRKPEKKNPFDATMPLDTDELKIVEARYRGQQVFWGVGKAVGIKTRAAGEVKLMDMSGSGEYEKERIYEWEYFYNPSAMPGFLPLEKAKELMPGTVSVVSGQVSSSGNPKPLTKEVLVGPNVVISPNRGIVLGPIPITTISVSPASVSENQEFTIAGTVKVLFGAIFPALVSIRVANPAGQIVDIASVSVKRIDIVGAGTTGAFSYTSRAGGTKYWTSGAYVATVTYGFSYGGKATTTSTSFKYTGAPASSV